MQREIYRNEKDRVRHDVESDWAAEGRGGVVRIFFHLLANFPKFDGLQVARSWQQLTSRLQCSSSGAQDVEFENGVARANAGGTGDTEAPCQFDSRQWWKSAATTTGQPLHHAGMKIVIIELESRIQLHCFDIIQWIWHTINFECRGPKSQGKRSTQPWSCRK